MSPPPALARWLPRGPSLFALFDKARETRRLDELCEFAPRDGGGEEVVFWFVQFVAWLRPRTQSVGTRLRFLESQLAQHPDYRDNLRAALGKLLDQIAIDRVLAYGGIPVDFHLGGAVEKWILDRCLPTACRTDDGAQVLRLAFVQRDLAWIGRREVMAFLRGLVEPSRVGSLREASSSALLDLAHQVVAQAHAPSVRGLARGERSPYHGLWEAAARVNESPGDGLALSDLRVRVEQAFAFLRDHRAELALRGADLNTTFQLTRMRQQLDRLSRLAELRHEPSDSALGRAATSIVGDVLRGASGRRLVTRSADLVVQNLVDGAANVGREYLDDEHSSFRAAFRAGVGGGALMVLAALVKVFLGRRHMSTLYEGIAFSLNYAAVFCAAYLLHATIATKLPAHTAAALARSAQSGPSHRARLAAFVRVWRSTLRLQLVGLVGNVVAAGPLGFLFAFAFRKTIGHPFLAAAEAEHMLRANSVFGPSIAYAALTGVFLWVSSLVGAWSDNWARVQHLTDRLATNRYVMNRVNGVRAAEWAASVVRRFGGMIGNATLGFLLGGVPAAFAIAGLRVEIRHVTVSTTSVALALDSTTGSLGEVTFALLGLVLIAAVNVSVSFLLALSLALRATRGMRASGSSHALVRIGLGRWAGRRRGAGLRVLVEAPAP